VNYAIVREDHKNWQRWPRAESFISFLSIYGDTHGPSMAYHEDADWATWCDELGEVIAGLRGIVPDRVEPSAEVLDESEEADHVRQLKRVEVSEFRALVAYLLMPKGSGKGRPEPASWRHTEIRRMARIRRAAPSAWAMRWLQNVRMAWRPCEVAT